MVIRGSDMFEFNVSKDGKKNFVDFGRREINKHEGGAPSLKSQV